MVTVVTGFTQKAIIKYIKNNFENTFTLGFPEEGRHPKYSCMLVDFTVSDHKQDDTVISTLSECIVNRIGYLIAKGVISEANIIWLDENNEDHKCYYNERGNVKGWPFGFFIPSRIL